MPRYALTLEFDGAPFVGWQRQANGLSVQQVLEEAARPLNGGAPAARRTCGDQHAAAAWIDLFFVIHTNPNQSKIRNFPKQDIASSNLKL